MSDAVENDPQVGPQPAIASVRLIALRPGGLGEGATLLASIGVRCGPIVVGGFWLCQALDGTFYLKTPRLRDSQDRIEITNRRTRTSLTREAVRIVAGMTGASPFTELADAGAAEQRRETPCPFDGLPAPSNPDRAP